MKRFLRRMPLLAIFQGGSGLILFLSLNSVKVIGTSLGFINPNFSGQEVIFGDSKIGVIGSPVMKVFYFLMLGGIIGTSLALSNKMTLFKIISICAYAIAGTLVLCSPIFFYRVNDIVGTTKLGIGSIICSILSFMAAAGLTANVILKLDKKTEIDIPV